MAGVPNQLSPKSAFVRVHYSPILNFKIKKHIHGAFHFQLPSIPTLPSHSFVRWINAELSLSLCRCIIIMQIVMLHRESLVLRPRTAGIFNFFFAEIFSVLLVARPRVNELATRLIIGNCGSWSLRIFIGFSLCYFASIFGSLCSREIKWINLCLIKVCLIFYLKIEQKWTSINKFYVKKVLFNIRIEIIQKATKNSYQTEG